MLLTIEVHITRHQPSGTRNPLLSLQVLDLTTLHRHPGVCGAAQILSSRFRCGADDPAPECDKIALVALEAASDQIPAHTLRHGQREWCDQPTGGEVIVDIGPNAHGDAKPVERG